MKEKEVVLDVEVFEDLIEYIKELENANKALNEQVRKYNKYAEAENELEKH